MMEQPTEIIGINPSQLKTRYSDEVIRILDEAYLGRLLKEVHSLRSDIGLKDLSDIKLMIYVLNLYKNKTITKKKRLEKNGFR